MKKQSIHSLLAAAALAALPGCLVTQTGSLEVLNPNQAYGRSVAVIGDLHRENEAIERRLASDLQAALAKRGLTVIEDPAKADLVVVPTLGRMRERAPAPVVPVEEGAPVEASEPVAASEPLLVGPAPEARPFHRFSSGNAVTRADLISRRAVPSARAPASAQQAGLLLTAYRAEDYRDYGVGRQSLPPVWRIYVSQPAVQMKWQSVAAPLVNAAASAAAPLGKSQEQGAGSRERGENKEEPAADQTEPPAEKKKSGERGVRSGEPDEASTEKRKFLGLFGRSVEKPESVPAGNRNQATGDRSESRAEAPEKKKKEEEQKTKRQKDEETNRQRDEKKGSVFRFFGRSVEKPESVPE